MFGNPDLHLCRWIFRSCLDGCYSGIYHDQCCLALLGLCLAETGGFTGLNNQLAAIDPTYLSIWGKGNQYEGAWGVIAGAVLVYLIGYMGLPHCVNKHMAMENPKTARKPSYMQRSGLSCSASRHISLVFAE
jgi:hypothetical protein